MSIFLLAFSQFHNNKVCFTSKKKESAAGRVRANDLTDIKVCSTQLNCWMMLYTAGNASA